MNRRAHMTTARALELKPGDIVDLDPLYNKTERQPSKVLTPTEVLAVRAVGYGGSQTGVLITVRTQSGKTVDLDAGWFKA